MLYNFILNAWDESKQAGVGGWGVCGPWQLIKGKNSGTALIAEHFAPGLSFTPSQAAN